MSFTNTWHQDQTKSFRGLAALLVAAAAAFAFFIGVGIFIWPPGPDLGPKSLAYAGRIDDLELRTPTAFHEGDLPYVWLVRLDEHEVIALIATDTARGCTVPWRPSFSFDGTPGWFRDPCSGSTYDLVGNCVFGPCPRGLDRFPVEMQGKRIQLLIREGQIIKGQPGKVAAPVRP